MGGLDAEEAKRLKLLEAENARLKRLVADQAIDISILKEANIYLGKLQAPRKGGARCSTFAIHMVSQSDERAAYRGSHAHPSNINPGRPVDQDAQLTHRLHEFVLEVCPQNLHQHPRDSVDAARCNWRADQAAALSSAITLLG